MDKMIPHTIIDDTAEQRRTNPARISLACLIALIAGILTAESDALWVVLLVMVGVGVWWLYGRRIYGGHFIGGVIALPFVLVGYGLASLGGDAAPLHPKGMVEARGTVMMAEAMSHGRQRIRFDPDSPIVVGDWRLIKPKELPELAPGDRVVLTSNLGHPLPQLLPDGFDFTANATAQGFSATGFIDDLVVEGKTAPDFVAGLRFAIQERITAILPEDQAAVASALLIGLRGLIAADLREDFRGSGLAHLLAISGLHMALFCGGVLFAIRLFLACFPVFSSRYSALKIAALIALPFGGFYLLVAGTPISAVRAFGMVCFVILAIVLDRRGMTLHHVAMMAILILLIEPGSLYHPSFQMSFAAVFALVASWMARQRYRRIADTPPSLARRILNNSGEIAIASLIASTATAPFVLYHFGVITVWSILANLAGMPLMALLIMPMGVVALLLMPFGFDGVAFVVMGQGIAMLIWVASTIADWPLSAVQIVPPPPITLIVLTLAMVFPFMARVGRGIITPALVVCGFVLWAFQPLPVFVATLIHNRLYVAVDSGDGVIINRQKTNNFTRSIVLKPFGVAQATYIKDAAQCFDDYCILPLHDGTVVAIVWRRAGLNDACSLADVIISHSTAPVPCQAEALVIDRGAIGAGGGVKAYRAGAGWRLIWVNSDGREFLFFFGLFPFSQ